MPSRSVKKMKVELTKEEIKMCIHTLNYYDNWREDEPAPYFESLPITNLADKLKEVINED